MSEKKSTGKSAGSTKQWRQLGGGKRSEGEESELQDVQPSEHLDSEESESPTIQPVEHSTIKDVKQLDSQESKRLEVEPSSHPTIQPSKSLESEKSSMPHSTVVEQPSAQKAKQQRDKLTVYLEPDLNDWIRQQVIIEKRRRGHHVEISDIINEALQRMKEGQLADLQPAKKVPPVTEAIAPEGFTYLSDFCTLHHVPYSAAEKLFPRAIRGQKITVHRHNYPVIGPKGKHDFWVQLHTRADYVTCDDCPHEVIE